MIDGLQARVTERFESIATMSAENDSNGVDFERLTYAKLEGPGVILAYQADDKAHVSASTLSVGVGAKFHHKKEPLEAILRSLFLVLMDNATAEYSFVASFFFVEPLEPPPSARELEIGQLSARPEPQDRKEADDSDSVADSEARTPIQNSRFAEAQGLGRLATMDKAERTELSTIWKKIFDPVLEYTKVGHGRQSQENELDSLFSRLSRHSWVPSSNHHHHRLPS